MKKSIRKRKSPLRKRKSPLRKPFMNTNNKPLPFTNTYNKPFMNNNKPFNTYDDNKPFTNTYNNKPFMNTYNNKPFMNTYNNNNPKINYNFTYDSDKIQPINNVNENPDNILDNNIGQTEILTNKMNVNENQNNYNILKDDILKIDIDEKINNNNEQTETKMLTNKHEKMAEIFSNPVLNDPEYVAKDKQIDDLQEKIISLKKEQKSIGSSTNKRWQELDKELFILYGERSNLIKESQLIANNFRKNNKDGKQRQKKKSRSKRKSSKRKRSSKKR